jgi:hypothetical protein
VLFVRGLHWTYTVTFSSKSSSSSVDSARWFTASTDGLWLGLPIRRAQQLNWRTSVVRHSHNTSERSFSFAPFHVQLFFFFLPSVVFNSLKERLLAGGTGWPWLLLLNRHYTRHPVVCHAKGSSSLTPAFRNWTLDCFLFFFLFFLF